MDGSTSENPFAEGFDNFVLVLDGCRYKSPERTAILLVYYHIMGDIDKTASQITCIRSFQGRIGKTLAGTVGGNEILEDRKTFLEVGKNRVFDDFRTLRT